jgi:hypothetical protein
MRDVTLQTLGMSRWRLPRIGGSKARLQADNGNYAQHCHQANEQIY